MSQGGGASTILEGEFSKDIEEKKQRRTGGENEGRKCTLFFLLLLDRWLVGPTFAEGGRKRSVFTTFALFVRSLGWRGCRRPPPPSPPFCQRTKQSILWARTFYVPPLLPLNNPPGKNRKRRERKISAEIPFLLLVYFAKSKSSEKR